VPSVRGAVGGWWIPLGFDCSATPTGRGFSANRAEFLPLAAGRIGDFTLFGPIRAPVFPAPGANGGQVVSRFWLHGLALLSWTRVGGDAGRKIERLSALARGLDLCHGQVLFCSPEPQGRARPRALQISEQTSGVGRAFARHGIDA
jgi:hypothetical protein